MSNKKSENNSVFYATITGYIMLGSMMPSFILMYFFKDINGYIFIYYGLLAVIVSAFLIGIIEPTGKPIEKIVVAFACALIFALATYTIVEGVNMINIIELELSDMTVFLLLLLSNPQS